jgi:N utilization substance protein B
VQFLYQFDVNRRPVAELLGDFWKLRRGPGESDVPAKTRTFAEELVTGVTTHLEEIDAIIGKYVENYEMNRIATVDRNILRVAIYEMLHCIDVPPVVSINEAIEIAKRFGSEESGRFVNGILDRVRGGIPRPARVAGKES